MSSPSRKLWAHQSGAINELWTGFKTKPRQLCVLPTGTGKSTIIVQFCEKLASVGYSCVLLLNRELLVTQFLKDMPELSTGVYAAGLFAKDASHPITVAMIQSIHSKTLTDVKVIIVDEAHNLQENGMYAEFISRHPKAKILGFTATPYNSNGYIFGKDSFFPRKDYFRTMESMIAEGILVPPVSRVVLSEQFDTSNLRASGDDFVLSDLEELLSDKTKAQSQVEDAMRRLVNRQKVLWMCLNIEHAETIQREIAKTESCSIIHSKQTKATQLMSRNAFEKGPTRHMVSVAMISEGYDYRPADALVMLRPTRSAKLYVQTVGRVLRASEGKKNALVLDYGEIIKNLGSVFDPHVERSSKRKAIDENKQGIFFSSGVRVCPTCFTVCPIQSKECEECGDEVSNEVDKHLKSRAAEEDIIKNGREYEVDRVELDQYEAKSGNNCIRVNYYKGLFVNSQYYTAHPFSWGMGRVAIRKLTGWDFESFQEAFDNINEVVVENLPVSIMVKKDGRYDKITKVNYALATSPK